MRMEWTTEPPAKSGWYWVWNAEIDRLQMVQVDIFPFYIDTYEGGGEPTCSHYFSHWLGPIEPPELPELSK